MAANWGLLFSGQDLGCCMPSPNTLSNNACLSPETKRQQGCTAGSCTNWVRVCRALHCLQGANAGQFQGLDASGRQALIDKQSPAESSRN